MICILHQILFPNDQIEKDGMAWVCSKYGGEVYTEFWWGNLSHRDHLEDPGADRRVILRCIFR
jgi:hypothetical protein